MGAMNRYPLHLNQLIEILRKLPSIGTKSAERLAFNLLSWDERELELFSEIISDIPKKLKSCEICGCLRGVDPCSFCKEERVLAQALCLIVSPKDAFAIESTRQFNGLYHVLGHLISPLAGVGPEKIPLNAIRKRVEQHQIKEIIIALDSTLEGDTTALYLKQELASLPVKISRLAFGMPIGYSIDYVDGNTLMRAFAGRSDLD